MYICIIELYDMGYLLSLPSRTTDQLNPSARSGNIPFQLAKEDKETPKTTAIAIALNLLPELEYKMSLLKTPYT